MVTPFEASTPSVSSMSLHSLSMKCRRTLHQLYMHLRKLPIVEFYTYMYHIDKRLFAQTLFVNYILPLILEGAPWYFSRRHLSKRLRDTRTAVQHELLTGTVVSLRVTEFIVLSFMYAIIHTSEETIRTRVMLANRLVVKRLIMERILYSEIGVLQQRYMEIFGEEVRTEQLEQRVFSDISDTLNLFNYTLPGIMRGIYTFILQSRDLYHQRAAIDVLSIARPSIVGLVNEIIDYGRDKYLIERQTIKMQKNSTQMSRIVSNIVDGLSEIQSNNMQMYQLQRLDHVINEEIDAKQGFISAFNSIHRIVHNRGVLDFASEIYVVHTVMQRHGITHEQYRKVQNDIDYVTRLFNRTWNMVKDAYRVLDTQKRVIALINLPNFLIEAHQLLSVPKLSFETLIIKKLRFRYKENLVWALNIDSNLDFAEHAKLIVDSASGPKCLNKISGSLSSNAEIGTKEPHSMHMKDVLITFERGKTYAIVGQNRSGKSTLVQILCKLYQPCESDITINGFPFSNIPRMQLRSIISYVAQRPFIFPGTIEENIRVGNFTATDADVEEAAEAAGIFIFEKPNPLIRNYQESVVRHDSHLPLKPWEENKLKTFFMAGYSWLLYRWQELFSPKQCLLEDNLSEFTRISREAALAGILPPDVRNSVDSYHTVPSTDCVAPVLPTQLKSNAVNAKHPILLMETLEHGANLSGGFAQSVALARVFLRKDAQIIILDEAMGQMDSIKKNDFIFPRLFDFVKRHNMTLIIISHDVSEVCSLVNEVYVMEKGQVMLHGSHASLIHQKALPYMRLCGLTC